MSEARERDRDRRDRDRDRDRREDKAWQRLDDLEDKLNRETNIRVEAEKSVSSVAKLGVFTARGLQEVQARYKVVGFCTGEFKKTLATKFVKYAKEAKEKREAKVAADKAKKETQAAAQEDEEELPSAVEEKKEEVPRKDWRHVFLKAVSDHLLEAAENKKVKDKVQGVLELLSGVPAEKSVAFVRMEPREAPPSTPKDIPWCCTIAFRDSPDGQAVRECLVEGCRMLYGKPCQLAFRADGANGKDRPLTAEVAGVAGLEVRTGKPKPGVSGANKRRSPDPGRGGKKPRG